MWAPVLALVLVLAGVQLPEVLVNAMKLLGSATTGVALFATGIVLFAQRITVSRFVVGAVAARNVVAPALLWVILAAIGMSHTDLRLAVLANALPAPAAAVIFAVQYRQGQREIGRSHPFLRLSGADERNPPRRLRQAHAVLKLEVASVEGHAAFIPQPTQDLDIFRGIAVAISEIGVAGPQPHLRVLKLVPAGHDVHDETAVADVVQCHRHASCDSGMKRRQGDRCNKAESDQ